MCESRKSNSNKYFIVTGSPSPPPFLLSYDERVLRNGSSREEVSALFRQTDSLAASAADVICGTKKKSELCRKSVLSGARG